MEEVMRHIRSKKILAMVTCLTLILPPLCFAGEGTQWGSTPGQTYTPEVSIPSPNDTSQSHPSSQTDPASGGQNLPPTLGDNSPLSLSDPQPGETPQTLTKEESAAVLVRVNELVNLALDSLTTQSENLSEKSGEVRDALNAEIQKYEAAHVLLKTFLETSEGSASKSEDGGTAANGTTAYEVLRRVDGLLSRELSLTAQNAEMLSSNPSENLVRRFTRYIAASVQSVREKMAEDTSLPEAKIFSKGESPEIAAEAPGVTRQDRAITRGESPVLSGKAGQSLQKDYQVLGAVVLNREMAKTYELLNPPQKLQPFIRWLLYERHLTKIRAEQYLAARAKVQAIFMRAKAGEGLIRYKGKIMETFLPLPGDENGGTFELIRRV